MLPDNGIHAAIPEAEYHADPRSLSSTGARTLLYDGPSHYKWQRENPVHKDAYDLGSVVHALVLGVGDFEVLQFDSWRTKAAQAARREAREAGATPILEADYARAERVRDAVRANTVAAKILAGGEPEMSMWATDPATGVLMRGRADYLLDGYLIDFKTSSKPVTPERFQKTAWDYGYHLQMAWYMRILDELGGPYRAPIWIVVNTTGPFDVSIMQPDDELLDFGFRQVRDALDLYARCIENDEWPPAYDPHEIHTISAPAWAK